MRIVLLALATLSAAACATVGVEEPAFNLLREDGAFEIREYAPTIIAETTLAGEAVKARNAGFQPLADYIFANDRNGGEIAMTAPVTQAKRQKIAMTAPVTQESSLAGWTIAFTMPANYTMETLPAPANRAVRLIQQPARRMAVLVFSGLTGEERMESKRLELFDRIAKESLSPVGEPVFAFYDPPWTLPFLRRSEVMVEVAAR
jgi:hypothetical protein